MSKLVPITAAQHGNKCWRRYSSYAFAANSAAAAVVASELPRAAVALPIAFLLRDQQQPDAGYTLAAVLGLEPNVNLCVGVDGRWLARYVPSSFRGYPFRLFQSEDGKLGLCIDEDSGLVAEDGGEPFFDDAGEVAAPLKEVMDFLADVERSRAKTVDICDLLQAHELIEPWKISLQDSSGERPMEGLYRINEAALNQLPAEALAQLRDQGALVTAYCQLISMQHLNGLGELAKVREQSAPKLDDVFQLKDDGVLRFDG
jgi:hypothetical protein